MLAHGNRAGWLPPILIAVVTAAVFMPSLSGEFVFDDQQTILENQHFRGLGSANLQWMFTTFHMGHYQPLSWLTLALDYSIWGMNPFGYHLTNLLLHCINAVLVYFIATRVIRARSLKIGATLAALIFALHPLRVESVAWVTERRDVLSSCFLLATVLAYLRSHQTEPRLAASHWMPLCLILYALSLLSRAMGVTLPIILLLLDWHPLDRLRTDSRRALIEKLPFAVLALVVGVVATIAQADSGAAAAIVNHPPAARIMQAAYGLAFYLYKTLLPQDLVPIYEISVPMNLASTKYVASAILVIVAAALLAFTARRWRGPAVAALCYIVILAPVLGFFQSGRQEVADRYSYLATIGFAILLGGWISNLKAKAGLALVIATSIVAALGVVTWRQCRLWNNSLALWTHAVESGPPSAMAHFNLGIDLGIRNRPADALRNLEKSISLNPTNAEAHYNIGVYHQQLGRPEQAIAAYREAIRQKPNYAVAYSNLGAALATGGRRDEAMVQLKKALEIQPDFPDAQCNLAVTLAGKGDMNGAVALLDQVVAVHPDHAKAHYNLARLLEARGQYESAIEHFRQAIQIEPANDQARQGLDAAVRKMSGPTSNTP